MIKAKSEIKYWKFFWLEKLGIFTRLIKRLV